MNDAEEPRGVVIHPDFGGLAQVKESNARLAPCKHTQTVVDDVARTVECGTCGKTLDPVEVLLEYARKERHWRHWQAEVDRCHNELEALKAEERKVKARTKSASRKEAAAAVAEDRARGERDRIAITEAARDITELCRRIQRTAQRRRTLESDR